jgi:hypothetical protein
MSHAARGFTYLWLLFLLAAGSATLAAIGERTSTAVQRERETELLFRGQAIAKAIGSYWEATPGKTKALPTSLQDLLDDRRGSTTQRHLRRLYADPYTGLDDWVLLKDDNQDNTAGIVGVHSRASARAYKTASLPQGKQKADARVSDHIFAFTPSASSAPLDKPPTSPNEPKTDATE